jgi:hypothetical protein
LPQNPVLCGFFVKNSCKLDFRDGSGFGKIKNKKFGLTVILAVMAVTNFIYAMLQLKLKTNTFINSECFLVQNYLLAIFLYYI